MLDPFENKRFNHSIPLRCVKGKAIDLLGPMIPNIDQAIRAKRNEVLVARRSEAISTGQLRASGGRTISAFEIMNTAAAESARIMNQAAKNTAAMFSAQVNLC